MTEVALLLPQPSNEMIYVDSRSVAPVSLNALTESDGHDGFNSASNGQPSTRHHLPTAPPHLLAGRFALWNPATSRGAMDAALQALIDKAICEKLDAVAKMLETRAGNLPYVKAWRRAAQIVRAQKPN